MAHENPGTPPAGMSMATTTRSGRTIRELQEFKDYVKYYTQSRHFVAFHEGFVSVCKKGHIAQVATLSHVSLIVTVCLLTSVISIFFVS